MTIRIKITKQFTSGPLTGNSVTETIETSSPSVWYVGATGIDHLTETPYKVTNINHEDQTND